MSTTTNENLSTTDQIEVIDLGEDTDSWLVLGEHDVNAARAAVHAHLVEQLGNGVDLDDFLQTMYATTPTRRSDFWWQELTSLDLILRHGDEQRPPHPEARERRGEATFTGTWFR